MSLDLEDRLHQAMRDLDANLRISQIPVMTRQSANARRWLPAVAGAGTVLLVAASLAFTLADAPRQVATTTIDGTAATTALVPTTAAPGSTECSPATSGDDITGFTSAPADTSVVPTTMPSCVVVLDFVDSSIEFSESVPVGSGTPVTVLGPPVPLYSIADDLGIGWLDAGGRTSLCWVTVSTRGCTPERDSYIAFLAGDFVLVMVGPISETVITSVTIHWLDGSWSIAEVEWDTQINTGIARLTHEGRIAASIAVEPSPTVPGSW